MPAYSYYNHSDPNQLHLVNTTWIKEQSFVFDNLQPESTYKVFIYTKLSKNGTILNPISNLNVTTRSLNPDPPENLTATILDYKTIKLDWLAPINKSRKTLDGYKILYSPPIPSVVVRTTTEQIELCCFEVGIEYKFQVFSLRKKLESLRSATINVRINPQVIVKNLRAKKLTTSSITLEWQANTNNVSKWFIIFDCGDYFTNFSKNITIDESLAEIDDLAPGVLYEFKIFPFWALKVSPIT
ncbi:Fibronectin type III domain containing protein 1 [Sarcoptes scabiei]|uniref:Fibronectin type III domain containing protein 1 n=1 Tax=Sarcoptes scabiei TaxID=52283 RepID=A0A131ZYU8_SARSC|nr:Fibronectin type III domain containing protein 1 [Sarcoptes scabiei]